MKEKFNLQDQFLNTVRKNNITVSITDVMDNIQTGKIESFDHFCISLLVKSEDKTYKYMYYKSSIICIAIAT